MSQQNGLVLFPKMYRTGPDWVFLQEIIICLVSSVGSNSTNHSEGLAWIGALKTGVQIQKRLNKNRRALLELNIFLDKFTNYHL